MRLLIFLLLGTLIFGFAFPAMLLFIALFGVILIAAIVINFLRGGQTFRVYTTRDFEHRGHNDDFEERQVFDSQQGDNTASSEQSSDFEDEGEVIELPATALRKEESSEDKH